MYLGFWSPAGMSMTLCIALALGCSSKTPQPEEPEGEREYDPGVISPPFIEDTGAPLPIADDTGQAASGQTVCYPGPLSDYTACFVVVEAHDGMGQDYAYPDPYQGNIQYSKPTHFIDLSGQNHGASLAPNFVFDEFMNATKGQYGLFQVHAVASLQSVREASGGSLTINSGYRNVGYNAGVGGAEYSRHMYGDAADIRSSVLSLPDLADLCEDLGAGFTKLYETHVHCDWRDDPLDTVFFE
jgi:hypothetical protein